MLHKLWSVNLVVPGFDTLNEGSDQLVDEFSESVGSLVHQVDIVPVLVLDCVLNLLMQLWNRFEAVLTGVHQIDRL